MDTQKALKLRRIVATPAGEKPRFEWKRLVNKRRNEVSGDCDVNEIADKIKDIMQKKLDEHYAAAS